MSFSFLKSTQLLMLTAIPLWASGQNWSQLQDFPGVERDDGTAFVVGNTAYCGTGVTAGFGTWADFYAFDFLTSTWTEVSPLPFSQVRQYAVGFASETHGYIFGGTDSGIFFNDLWRYDPLLDTWTEAAPMPAGGRSGAMCFVIGDDAYILGGKTPQSQAIDEVWVYHMANDTWEQKAPMPFGARWRAAAAAVDGVGYLLFGLDEDITFLNTFHSYNPETDTWTDLEAFPGAGRNYVAMEVVGNQLTTFSGFDDSGEIYNDIWQYHSEDQTWVERNPLPVPGRRGGMSFSDGNGLYYTTGLTADFERVKETWVASDLVGAEDQLNVVGVLVYPNPCQSVCTISLGNAFKSQRVEVRICDPLGRVWLEQKVSSTENIELYVDVLPAGIYLIQANQDGKRAVTKFIKN